MTPPRERPLDLPLDVNVDLGEDPAALAAGVDAALLEHVTSCNVACGGHAGDAASMRAVLRLARERGVAAGAHPSYPDRAGFGRTRLALAAAALTEALAAQIGALAEAARAEGVQLTHVKAHGALYHACSDDPAQADALRAALAAAARAHPDVLGGPVVLVAQAGSRALARWRAAGCAVRAEAFVDRRYEADGTLRARSLPGALLLDPAEAAEQARRLACGEGARTLDGRTVPVTAQTLCLHADTPGAPAIARAVAAVLRRLTPGRTAPAPTARP